MAVYEAGSITTNGVEVSIKVNDDGDWTAEYAGKHLSSDTRDKLKGKLARLTRGAKVELEIPVIRTEIKGLGGDTVVVRRGVLTGVHGGTGNVLAAWMVRGQTVKEQITGWESSSLDYVAGDTTDEELKEYAGIIRSLSELRDREDKWLRRHRIDPKKVVETAIQARLGQDGDEG